MVDKRIESKFYRFVSIHVQGTLDNITQQINLINQDKKKQFVFLSNIVVMNEQAHAIIQYKESV